MTRAVVLGGRGAGVVRIDPRAREHALLTLWIIVTFKEFEGDELLLYPLALYFLYAAIRDLPKLAPLLAPGAVLLVFPTWWLISVLWADAPAAAFRSGLQLVLTILICFHAAAWLSPRQVMASVFIAAAVAGVLSAAALTEGAGAARGLFPHKNVLGGNMAVLWLTSLALLLDPHSPRSLRLAAAPAAVLAIALVAWSQSATAYLLSAAGAGVVAGGALLLRRSSIFRADRLAMLFLAIGLAAGGVAATAATGGFDPVDSVLEAVGKDRTITGRTGLWEYAEDQIAKRPWLGVGPGGFWRYDESPLVQRIYAEYYKGPKSYFSFHNSYYEIAVHLGIIGAAMAFLTLLWAVLVIVVGTLRRGGMPYVFFTAIALVVTARSFTEADLLKPFVLLHMLVWIGALSILLDERRRSGAARSPAAPRPSAGSAGAW